MPPRNLLLIALTIVISLACYSVASKNRYANLFAETMEVIDRQSLREIPREKLFVSAMEGMLEDLDGHSMYISGDMFTMFDEDMKQEFGGVGMYVENDPETKQLVVLAPMPKTPAFEAGLKPGDQIVSIDGNVTKGKARGEAIKLLRGPIGQSVELEIERGNEEFTTSLKRAIIPVASVHGDYRNADGSWNFTLKERPRVGYIRLIQFGEKSSEELLEALTSIEGKVDAIVFDVRNNSGGLLDVAIEICDMFLGKDLSIVSIRGRGKKLIAEYTSTSSVAVNPGIPVAVLINRRSASASEILAGCLQDHERAILVGEQSWGKGTVQNVIPIQRGESALKLTTASYWRPSGKNIDRFDEIAKKTKIWGVQANQGYAIEMTENEVFENVRQRNLRDLQGLVAPEDVEMITNLREQAQREALAEARREAQKENDQLKVHSPDETPTEDVLDPNDPSNDPAKSIEPHVDRPMERALDYFRKVLKERQVAA
ncbi:MAG: S41 family peptidase [Mariniblastus sp.]